MKNKNIVVIYSGDDWDKEIPISSEPTRKNFEDWHERGEKIGISFFRSSIHWFDLEKGYFIKGWAYRNKKWLKIEEPIFADMIYDKVYSKYDYELFSLKLAISQKIKMFNHPLSRTSLDNKLTQYLILKEFMAPSFLATNQEEFLKEIEKISTKKVVVKPLYGSGGNGIVIEEKEKINIKDLVFPVLLQEFILSEKGIPGFSEKNEVSDLRMIFINHKFIYALSRIAKNGSLFTNFHQGATAAFVPEEKIPSQIYSIVEKIIDKLKIFSETQYSLDFIFNNSGEPILVEINSNPGGDLLHMLGSEELKEKFFTTFANLI